jgi:hypothetical protein
MTDIIVNADKTLVLNLFIGLTMLLVGHRVFWLFVGGMVYLYISEQMTEAGSYPPDAIMAYGLFAGVFASVAAFFLHKITLGVVGFFVGGIALVSIMQSLGVEPSSYLFTFLMGAVFGVIFFSYLFDWTMVLMSSWLGAAYLTSLAPFGDETQKGVAMLVLTLIGVLFQGYQLYKRKK